MLDAFAAREVEYAVLPVYNTREGEKKQYFRFFDQIKAGYWVDNVILHSSLSLGVFNEEDTVESLRMLVGKREVFNQCEEFIENRLPGITEMSVQDIDQAITEIRDSGQSKGRAVIDNAETLDCPRPAHHRARSGPAQPHPIRGPRTRPGPGDRL